jgi:Putative Zn-dependent protease, contains TPR repeats
MLFLLLPAMADRLAARLPPGGEAALGETTLAQVRRAFGGGTPLAACEEPAGRAALEAILARLGPPPELGYPLTVTVLDHPMVNAAALPGGQVLVFRGLIEAAEAPEEVAAVIAHEIGHVAARDPTRMALRSAGSVGVLGLVLGDFAGGTLILLLTDRLIDAQYAQGAERAADAYAVARLEAAGIPPDALAGFFRRLAEEQGERAGLVRHLMSHPSLTERIAATEGEGATPAEPLLAEEGWAALRSICD